MKLLIETVNRKELKEERIAICSQFGCNAIKKVKPLKLGFLGFNKYPKCSKHNLHLIFVDEFIGTFIESVSACLFDVSSLPPDSLRELVSKNYPKEFPIFINNWIYCSPIGRGAQIVSRYLDGLSRGYIKLLSRKQKKAVNKNNSSKYFLLRTGLNIISEQYTKFLKELRDNSDLTNKSKLLPLSNNLKKKIRIWLDHQSESIKQVKTDEENSQSKNLLRLKELYDKILNSNTCSLLLGNKIKSKMSAFELFSAYFEFNQENLCNKISKIEIEDYMNNIKANSLIISSNSPFDNKVLFEFINLHQNHLKNKNQYITREYLCEICSKVAINKNSLPKELYIDKMENLVYDNKKNFEKVLNDWAKAQGFIFFNEYVSKFKLKRYKLPPNPSNYLKKPIKIDFDKLIKPYVENMKKWVREKDYVDIILINYGGSTTPQKIKEIYKKRTFYGWSGLIYRITQIRDIYGYEISNGLIQIGMTTEKFDQRWFWYQRDAFVECNRLRIHNLMRNMEVHGENLRKIHPIDSQGEGYIGDRKSFKYEIIEFCWTDSKLRKREIAWISHFKKKFPRRVANISKGGGGGSLISIPRSVLIPLIAKGLWSPDISRIIKQKYNRNISKDVVTKRIKEYWGSFERARRLFLKPVFKELMAHGYSATYLSKNLFKSVENHTISKWCGEIFWNIPFKEKRKNLIKKRLENLILKGYNSYEMDFEFNGVPWETIRKEYISEWWGDLLSARKIILKPILSKMLAQKKDIVSISRELNHDSIERTRYLISICWNFKSEKCKWNTIKKFLDYISIKKLKEEEINSLDYNQIKKEISSLNYLKFVNCYQENPNITFKEFNQLFPNSSKTNFYYWRDKAKREYKKGYNKEFNRKFSFFTTEFSG